MYLVSLTLGLLDRRTIEQSDYSSDPLEILSVSHLSSPVLLLTLYLYDLPGILFLLKTNRVIVNYTRSLVHVPVCMYIYIRFCLFTSTCITVVKELRSKILGQHPGYFKAVFLKKTQIIIVSIYEYTVYIMF